MTAGVESAERPLPGIGNAAGDGSLPLARHPATEYARRDPTNRNQGMHDPMEFGGPVGRKLPEPLLTPGAPPAYEAINSEGAAPVVFLCDHASNRVPPALAGLGLPPEALERHIAWDIGAGPLTRGLAAHFDAPGIVSGYSRLVIDCNRSLEDRESIIEVSDGVEVPGNRNLTAGDASARAEAFFRPYHDACGSLIDRTEARFGVVPVIALHTFTPALDGGPDRPWHIGILWNRDDRIAAPMLRILRGRGDLHVGDNQPYSGTSGRGYTAPFHAERHGRPSVLVEVRQDLVADDIGVERWTGILADTLTRVLPDPALRVRRRY